MSPGSSSRYSAGCWPHWPTGALDQWEAALLGAEGDPSSHLARLCIQGPGI